MFDKNLGAPFFFLSPRGTSGERIEERGFPKSEPPLPGPLLHSAEERAWLRLRRAVSIRVHLWFRFSP
jgi:hypothetical protein